jgi:hypothetical protein
MLHPNASEDDKATVEMFKKMVRNVRRDEQEGLVLPMDYDDNGNELYKFELLNSGGTRAINIDGAITRYEQRIAMTILADFILLGHEQTGSYALSVNKTGIFRTALNSWAQADRRGLQPPRDPEAVRPQRLAAQGLPEDRAWRGRPA